MKTRLEVSTLGLDEALQGESSDPFTPQANSVATGLRIPAVLSTTSTPSVQPRYLFTLCSLTFQRGIRLLGLRQGYTIGMDANEGTPPERPIEMFVRTPTFRFVDGNISWHVVVERQPNKLTTLKSSNTQSWAYLQSDSPAMLYQTFMNSNTNPSTGAPIFYMQNLTAYAPPDLSAQLLPVAGLGNIHDLRFPWDSGNAWRSFGNEGVQIRGGGRLSFYASVLQTNPNNRGNPSKLMTSLSASALPEEAFIQDYTVGGEPNLGPMFWRIMGAMLVETEV